MTGAPGNERQRETSRACAESEQADPDVELHAAGAAVGPDPQRGRLSALHRHPQLRAHPAGDGRLPRVRERFLRPIEVAARVRDNAAARGAAALARRCANGSAPVLAALRHRHQSHRHAGRFGGRAVAAARAIGGAGRPQGAVAGHPAQNGSWRGGAQSCHGRGRARGLRQGPRRRPRHAQRASIRRAGAADGAAGREVILGIKRDADLRPAADGGSRRRCGRGAEGCAAGAGALGRAASADAGPPQGRGPARVPTAARRRPTSTPSST